MPARPLALLLLCGVASPSPSHQSPRPGSRRAATLSSERSFIPQGRLLPSGPGRRGSQLSPQTFSCGPPCHSARRCFSASLPPPGFPGGVGSEVRGSQVSSAHPPASPWDVQPGIWFWNTPCPLRQSVQTPPPPSCLPQALLASLLACYFLLYPVASLLVSRMLYSSLYSSLVGTSCCRPQAHFDSLPLPFSTVPVEAPWPDSSPHNPSTTCPELRPQECSPHTLSSEHPLSWP